MAFKLTRQVFLPYKEHISWRYHCNAVRMVKQRTGVCFSLHVTVLLFLT